jgi:RHS repeat-associated protein
MFAGEPWEADADLQYLRARHYAPGTGRFASMDPFAGLQERPDTRHRYAYAGGNPVGQTDPSGMFFSMGAVMTTVSVLSIGASIPAGPSQQTLSQDRNWLVLDFRDDYVPSSSSLNRPAFQEAVVQGMKRVFEDQFRVSVRRSDEEPPPLPPHTIILGGGAFFGTNNADLAGGDDLGQAFGDRAYVFTDAIIDIARSQCPTTWQACYVQGGINTAAHEAGHTYGLSDVEPFLGFVLYRPDDIMGGGSVLTKRLDWAPSDRRRLEALLGKR